MKYLLFPLSVLALLVNSAVGQVEPSRSAGDLTAAKALPILIDDVWIPARDPGVISSLDIREGEAIEIGQTIARLDSELYEVEVNSAQEKLKIAEFKASDDVDMRYAEKSKAVANATLSRSDTAWTQYPKAVSRTDLDRLRLEVERAELSIEKAQFDKQVATREAQLSSYELEAARLRLRQRTIQSPIPGIVVQLLPQEGEWVAAGAPIARVIRLDTLRITALIEYDQIDQSFIGRIAQFRPRLATERVYEGPIKFVSPEVVPDTNLVQFYFDVENPDRHLRPGEPGQATILSR